ncbi:MAG: hypothetical protein ACJ73E_01830 [Mycobacteriales bacterium]
MDVLVIDSLDHETCDVLPARDALALINISTITAVNLAIAVNAASPGSQAVAVAGQVVGSFQH